MDETDGEIQELQWEPRKLSSGIYVIRLKYDNKVGYKKVTYIK